MLIEAILCVVGALGARIMAVVTTTVRTIPVVSGGSLPIGQRPCGDGKWIYLVLIARCAFSGRFSIVDGIIF